MLIAGTAIVALLVFLRVGSSAGADANVETAEVVIGDFVDSLTFRGDIKATQSAIVTAPSGAGELQIIKLARANVPVSRGDIVVQFDGTQVLRTLQEKRTALRQAEAEIEKARAQAKIDQEATRTEQMKGQYDVERAKLDVGTREVVSTYDAAKAELSLSDAQQRVKEVDARLGASQASQRAELQGLIYKREKAAADVALAEKQSQALTVKAPVSGPFMVQNLWRGPGMESEYREGDRAWSGAIIAEIPDPSKIYLAARVDEADRGRLKPGMTARVTTDALPGVELAAKLVDVQHAGAAGLHDLAAAAQFRRQHRVRQGRRSHPSRHERDDSRRGRSPRTRAAGAEPRGDSDRRPVDRLRRRPRRLRGAARDDRAAQSGAGGDRERPAGRRACRAPRSDAARRRRGWRARVRAADSRRRHAMSAPPDRADRPRARAARRRAFVGARAAWAQLRPRKLASRRRACCAARSTRAFTPRVN